MAVLKVNPNRMELAKLKKRMKVAQKGHKLLKDKQEQLIRHFFSFVKEYKTLRKDVDDSLLKAYQSFILASNSMGKEKIKQAIMSPLLKTHLEFKQKQIMNLKVPVFDIKVEGEAFSYSLLETSVQLDESVSIFGEVLKKMILLAEIEKSIIELAKEIISTRRRVNALEYILIPDLVETIKSIKSKLSEIERANTIQLMFVK